VHAFQRQLLCPAQFLLHLDSSPFPKVIVPQYRRHAEAVGQFAVRVRHVSRGALVAHMNYADAFCIGRHPDRHDVSTAERSDALGDAIFGGSANLGRANVRYLRSVAARFFKTLPRLCASMRPLTGSRSKV
jgi:hypothetical protein